MYDILIRNGQIVDGTGAPWYHGDVAISGDTIEAMGFLKGAQATRTIDAEGQTVCPGFIDPHTHSDFILFDNPAPDYKLRQGITSEVVGNCGISLAPLDESTRSDLEKYVDFLKRAGTNDWQGFDEYMDVIDQKAALRTNIMALVGHGALRIAAMGFNPGEPSLEEMEKMKQLLIQGLNAGALGMSTGLIYPPGSFSKLPEIIELTKELEPFGAVYFSHIRGESDTLLEAVDEAIEIGRQTGVPVHIAHHKAMGSHMWGRTQDSLMRIEQARNQGIDVTADVYPYIASSGPLHAMLPPWAAEGGVDAILERVKNQNVRRKMEKDMLQGLPGWSSLKGVGWGRIMIAQSKDETIQGLNVEEIAKSRGIDPFQCAFDILLTDSGSTQVIKFTADEKDLQRVLSHPAVMVGSDSATVSGQPHPRNYGTFPRVLAHYVREKHTLTLEGAIQKMTSMPAARCGLGDRGILKAGMKADVVMLDPKTVGDRSTFTDPHHCATGISCILVNGHVAFENGKTSEQTAGRLIRRK